MSYNGKGQPGEILKVGQSGRPFYRYQAAPVLVASGTALSPDFNTVGEAVTAGANKINVIGDTYETGVFTPASPLSIELSEGAQLDFGAFGIGGSLRVDIYGNGSIRYAGTSTAPFSCPVDLDGISVVNESSDYAPISSANNNRISNCDFVGDLVLEGSGLLVGTTTVVGNIYATPTCSGANVSQSRVVGGVVLDSGVATILSNIKFD